MTVGAIREICLTKSLYLIPVKRGSHNEVNGSRFILLNADDVDKGLEKSFI